MSAIVQPLVRHPRGAPERPKGARSRPHRSAHARLKQGLFAYLLHAHLGSVLMAPAIYSLIAPLLLLDAWVTIYQWICFPIYGVARVPRSQYFIADRQRLAYLNGIEKMNCTFCAYATGLFAYVREVTAGTEAYWCPIKHARAVSDPHSRYEEFFEFGDAAGYRNGLSSLRRTLDTRPRGPSRPRRFADS